MLVDHRGNPLRTKQESKPVRARYDAASQDLNNATHWLQADSLSAVLANSEPVRKRLRERSRYEVANNSYARGAINTIANYTVGQGPSLQLTFRGDDVDDLRSMRQAAHQVEALWNDWQYSRKLYQKLWSACVATDVDGEAFGLLINGGPASDSPVELDVRLYEADQFADSTFGIAADDDSGVRLGPGGEPVEYAMLERHPGDFALSSDMQPMWLPASQVIHCFRHERLGQVRGVPRTTPALPLFAQLRRFTLATLTAAETAADLAAILQQETPGDEETQLEPWDRVPFERGALMTVPGGTSLSQLRAEHPNSTYDGFVRTLLREIGRCLDIPAVLMLGDASGYNYASGRLDLQSFQRSIAVDRTQILEREFLDRVFMEWLREAALLDGFLPDLFVEAWPEFEVSWRWSEPEHVDRKKEADGQSVELANNTTTLAREYARRGRDWEEELRQRAREMALMNELGLPQSMPGPAVEDEDDG